MKTLILAVSFLISSITLAQQTEKNLGDFNELKVYDLIEVELVKSNQNKAIITGNNSGDVVINNKNGVLKIKMNIGKTFDGTNTKVILHYQNLDVIDANEGAKITGKDTIKQYEIDLRAQEGGSISMPLNVTFANIKSVTGGMITTSGKSTSQTVIIFTGGVYDGKALKTEATDASINAGGEALIYASKKVDAKVRAGGDINVFGKPDEINKSTALGGSINVIN